MTTNDTTSDVYGHLMQLQQVRAHSDCGEMRTKVREITEQIRPAMEQARLVLAAHEARASSSVPSSSGAWSPSRTSRPATYDMGLQEISGVRTLWTAMQELAQLCDPDTLMPADGECAQESLTD